MAIAALPRVARRYAPRLRDVAARVLSPAKPVLKNLAAIPFTVAGWCLMSACAFQISTTLGLGASAVILMVLEHQIADEA